MAGFYFYGVDPGGEDSTAYVHRRAWGQQKFADDEKARRRELGGRILKALNGLNLIYAVKLIIKTVSLAELEKLVVKLERDHVSR